MKLGLDLYSVRSQGWSPFEALDYCRRLEVNVAHFGTSAFSRFDKEHLLAVRACAADLGLEIEYGIGSICELSPSFVPAQGTAVEQARSGLRTAALLGSPVLRCLLGAAADRAATHPAAPQPLEARIAAVVATCRAVRSQALGLGIRLAIETHGDLQGLEMRALIEEAGPDYVGALIDTGNSVMLHEDPMVTLEQLAPYIVASHFRDSALWAEPSGAAVQWVAMGEGTVGIERVAERYRTLCPGATFTIEVITGRPPRILNYLEPRYWAAFPRARASEFARFLALVLRGRPYTGAMIAVREEEAVPAAYAGALALQQRLDVERSVRYCRDTLGMGE